MMIFGMVVSQKALDYSYYLTLLFNLFVMACSAIYFYKTRRQNDAFWFCHGPLICILIGMSLLQLDPLKNATMTACRVALQPAYAKYGFESYVEKILGFLFFAFPQPASSLVLFCAWLRVRSYWQCNPHGMV